MKFKKLSLLVLLGLCSAQAQAIDWVGLGLGISTLLGFVSSISFNNNNIKCNEIERSLGELREPLSRLKKCVNLGKKDEEILFREDEEAEVSQAKANKLQAKANKLQAKANKLQARVDKLEELLRQTVKIREEMKEKIAPVLKKDKRLVLARNVSFVIGAGSLFGLGYRYRKPLYKNVVSPLLKQTHSWTKQISSI